MENSELERMTFDHLSTDFFGRALQAIFFGHKIATEQARSVHAKTEADNVLPYVRRAMIEGLVRDAAERTGYRVDTVKAPKSGWNHIEVKSGPVILAVSSVPFPCAPVDPSEFRLTLAKPNEILLWDEPGDAIPEDTPLYALLLHSRNQWTPNGSQADYSYLPGSVHIAFPVPKLDDYIHSVNLFDLFPDVIELLMPKEWNVEARVQYLHNARRIAAA